jgi:hypothetical protein
VRLWTAEAREKLVPVPSVVVRSMPVTGDGVRLNIFDQATWTLYSGVLLQGSGGIMRIELRARQMIRHAQRTGERLVVVAYGPDGTRNDVQLNASQIWLLGLHSRPMRLPMEEP